MPTLRALTRLIGAVLMLALALLGLGVALYCFDAVVGLGSIRPDRLLHLSRVRDHIGHWLAQLATPGQTAGIALLCGLGAIALGVLLLLGTLRSSQPRLAVLESSSEGTLAARPRVLGEMAQTLAQRTDGTTGIRRPRLSFSHRRRRGRIVLRGERSRSSDPEQVSRDVVGSVAPIADPFHLKPRVHLTVGESGSRAQ
ncbi:MAG: hypothetical protein WAK93_04780 [Solirubrobacteraceae bacterium]